MSEKPEATAMSEEPEWYARAQHMAEVLQPNTDGEKWAQAFLMLLADVRRLRSEYGSLSVDYANVVSDHNQEIDRLRAENAHLKEEHLKNHASAQRVIAEVRAESARQAETITKLREAAQNLVDFWNTLTEEQTKLTPVEADELAELESQLREALKETV